MVARPSTVRLTRRGVAVLWLVTAAVGLLLAIAGYASWRPDGASASAGDGGRPSGTVFVQPGDTLWSIAGRVAPDRDPREVVSDLRKLNHLTSVDLVLGQSLRVG